MALAELPPVSQIGFVVADLSAAIAAFEPVYGPFTVHRFENAGFDFRGEPADCVLDVAFADAGSIEIELLSPVIGRGPHREFLDAGRQGFHHFQHRFDHIDPIVDALVAQGYERIWFKRSGPRSAVAYLARPGDAFVIELVEPLYRADRATAGAWAPPPPVR